MRTTAIALMMLWFSASPGIAQPQTASAPAPSEQTGTRAPDPREPRDGEPEPSRKAGKKGVGNWYSLESEIRIGKEYAASIESYTRMLNDPVVTEYVNRLGQTLVRNSDAQVPFTIKVIDSDEVNAFALPGGFMYVNSGLILAAADEAELAGVMAHEIAHVAARHAMRQKTRSNILSLASVPLIFLGGGIGYAVKQAAALAVPLSMTKFSRGFEAEADHLGIIYAYKAGYDPLAFITFFERAQQSEKQQPGFLTKLFANHPPTAERVKKTQGQIDTALPAREAYIVTTSEFEEVKAHLALAHRSRDTEGEGVRPTLKRRTETTNEHETDRAPDDSDVEQDRPTLKRRPQP